VEKKTPKEARASHERPMEQDKAAKAPAKA